MNLLFAIDGSKIESNQGKQLQIFDFVKQSRSLFTKEVADTNLYITSYNGNISETLTTKQLINLKYEENINILYNDGDMSKLFTYIKESDPASDFYLEKPVQLVLFIPEEILKDQEEISMLKQKIEDKAISKVMLIVFANTLIISEIEKIIPKVTLLVLPSGENLSKALGNLEKFLAENNKGIIITETVALYTAS